MFSKKATKTNKIFSVDLRVTIYCQIDGEDFVKVVAFSENMNYHYTSQTSRNKTKSMKLLKSRTLFC